MDKSCANGLLLIRSIFPEEVKIMRFANDRSLCDTEKINISDKLMNDLKSQMKFYLEYILEKELYSANFYENVNNLK